MSSEDANCNGAVDPGESSAIRRDTDNDGVERSDRDRRWHQPDNPTSNPQANGDFVFIEPFQSAQSPLSSDLDFSTKLQAVDLYVMLDRSGSMATEISTVKTEPRDRGPDPRCARRSAPARPATASRTCGPARRRSATRTRELLRSRTGSIEKIVGNTNTSSFAQFRVKIASHHHIYSSALTTRI